MTVAAQTAKSVTRQRGNVSLIQAAQMVNALKITRGAGTVKHVVSQGRDAKSTVFRPCLTALK